MDIVAVAGAALASLNTAGLPDTVNNFPAAATVAPIAAVRKKFLRL
jgi:hypothetical protein